MLLLLLLLLFGYKCPKLLLFFCYYCCCCCWWYCCFILFCNSCFNTVNEYNILATNCWLLDMFVYIQKGTYVWICVYLSTNKNKFIYKDIVVYTTYIFKCICYIHTYQHNISILVYIKLYNTLTFNILFVNWNLNSSLTECFGKSCKNIIVIVSKYILLENIVLLFIVWIRWYFWCRNIVVFFCSWFNNYKKFSISLLNVFV